MSAAYRAWTVALSSNHLVYCQLFDLLIKCIDNPRRCWLRYKAELKRRQSGAEERQPVVPELSEPTDQSDLSRLPDVINVDPDIVFLCRYVYDVKLHRILKNPPAHPVPMWWHLLQTRNGFHAVILASSVKLINHVCRENCTKSVTVALMHVLTVGLKRNLLAFVLYFSVVIFVVFGTAIMFSRLWLESDKDAADRFIIYLLYRVVFMYIISEVFFRPVREPKKVIVVLCACKTDH